MKQETTRAEEDVSGKFMPSIELDENYNTCYGYALAASLRLCLADVPLLAMHDCADYNTFMASEAGSTFCGPDVPVVECIEFYCGLVCPTSEDGDYDYEEQENACRLSIYSCCVTVA
jgi:hypothetical protein